MKPEEWFEKLDRLLSRIEDLTYDAGSAGSSIMTPQLQRARKEFWDFVRKEVTK